MLAFASVGVHMLVTAQIFDTAISSQVNHSLMFVALS